MDVFYYWKDIKQDIAKGRIGFFESRSVHLKNIAESADFIWAFNTPKGCKGNIQLLARLRCVSSPVARFDQKRDHYYMYYDPAHPDSITFPEADSPAAVEQTTLWAKTHFLSSIVSNFQGLSGQFEMRGLPVAELRKLATRMPAQRFLAVAEAAA
jgi:hypothetical protein